MIVKQATPTDHFNVGSEVVGILDHALGSSIITEKKLHTIDLSSITNIVPLDNRDGSPKAPNTEATYEHLDEGDRSGIQDVGI